jgi:Plant transposon protein
VVLGRTIPNLLFSEKTRSSKKLVTTMDIIWDDDDEVTDAVALILQMEDDSDTSDDDDDIALVPVAHLWGSGSRPGKAPNLERHRVFYSHLLFKDYWGPQPVYNQMYFKRFFKVPIGLFDDIVERVTLQDDYFRQKTDVTGKLGFTPLQKMCSAVRLLTSGVSSSEQDDKYRMAATTGMECMKRFCNAMGEVYGPTVLRHPNAVDIGRLLDEGCDAGFPGCIGSIDCMHWKWKNCPSGWKGMFQGKAGVATIVLEAIADNSCRFWHFNFGAPGALNDVNVLDRSPLFDNAVRGEAPAVNFTVNGHDYKHAYWLGDGIYPRYACFIKTFPRPATRMQKMFASAQEAKRKDIERAFGMLQARFHILTSPCRLWDREAMDTVIRTCVILHNMVIDYEREHNIDAEYINDEMYVPQHPFTVLARDNEQNGIAREQMVAAMKDSDLHDQLQYDLMIERWAKWYHGADDDDDEQPENENDVGEDEEDDEEQD